MLLLLVSVRENGDKMRSYVRTDSREATANAYGETHIVCLHFTASHYIGDGSSGDGGGRRLPEHETLIFPCFRKSIILHNDRHTHSENILLIKISNAEFASKKSEIPSLWSRHPAHIHATDWFECTSLYDWSDAMFLPVNAIMNGGEKCVRIVHNMIYQSQWNRKCQNRTAVFVLFFPCHVSRTDHLSRSFMRSLFSQVSDKKYSSRQPNGVDNCNCSDRKSKWTKKT